MDFEESEYLAANPDVAAVVSAGYLQSGLDHYEKYGKQEGRAPGFTRQQRALFSINKNGLGLEIGPSFNPIAPKKLGYNVHILDHLDAIALREKYASHGVNINNIEDVDFVWSGQNLSDLIGRSGCYDWIIASHVVEHVPDLISFFQQCETLMNDDGKLSLVIPDKRYCFDYFNPPTSTGALLDAFHEKRKKPSPGQVFDNYSNACMMNGAISWSKISAGEFTMIHKFEFAKNSWLTATNTDAYIDVHCWRFTPENFRFVLNDLRALGLTSLSVVNEFYTKSGEFFVALSKAQNVIKCSRIESLNTIKCSCCTNK